MLELLLDGVLLSPRRWGGNPQIRSAYRGPEPGSRETGSAQFTVFTITEPEYNAVYLRMDAAVVIQKDGRTIFRGQISGLERERYRTMVSTVETSARLAEFDAGLAMIGPIANPDLDVYTQTDAQGRFLVRVGSEPADPITVFGWTKEWLFDSYFYGEWNRANGIGVRAMIWAEQSLTDVVNSLLELYRTQGGTGISGADVRLTHTRSPVTVTVLDEAEEIVALEWIEGDPIGHWNLAGLINRTIYGRNCTFAWVARGTRLELYQLVNHGLARPLGGMDLQSSINYVRWIPDKHRPPFNDPHPIFGDTWGPFQILPFEARPDILSFYLIGGRRYHIDPTDVFSEERFYQKVAVVEINLSQFIIGDAAVERELTWSGYGFETDHSFNEHPWYKPYLVMSGVGNYLTTENVRPLFYLNRPRTGGEYTISSGRLHWDGDVWFSEVAADFHGAKLRDILRELSLLAGCEWWVDSGGVLRMERMDGSPRSSSAQRARVMSDELIIGEAGEAYNDFSPAGCQVNGYYELVLRRAIQNLVSAASGDRRRTRFLPVGTPDLALGALLTLDGVASGKIVAIEEDAYTVTVEVEG